MNYGLPHPGHGRGSGLWTSRRSRRSVRGCDSRRWRPQLGIASGSRPQGEVTCSGSGPGGRSGSASEVGSRYRYASRRETRPLYRIERVADAGGDRTVERSPVRLRGFVSSDRCTRPGIQLSGQRTSRYANGCGSWSYSRRIDRSVQRGRVGRVDWALRGRTRRDRLRVRSVGSSASRP